MAKDAAPGARDATPDDLNAELVSALAARQFFLVYQPTIDLRTGAFAGVEALIRWRHPSRGVLGPADFLHELAESDLVASVGRWTLETACRQGALWHRKGYRFPVSVNIAPRQFASERFVEDVSSAASASRLAPSQLILEFAERTLALDDPDVRARIAALVDAGVRLAVDDFDLGRSSLTLIAASSVSVVKLSRASLASLTGAGGDGARLHELVAEARDLKVQVIASGVEDKAQRKLLAAEHVDQGQGFLFARPFEVGDIDRLLEDFALFSGEPL
ncbi:MAG: EAL domain-containing protein [Acidobacteriota bacterium]|nr:EAL domain-containing protein [Acidobacteriota bacterium]